MRTIHRVEPLPQPPSRKRVAAYARVSCEKDSMLNSLSAQVSYYSGHIQKNRAWEYIGVYADAAFTGTKEARPEFQRLLADCRAGNIDIVLTKSISRFARNTVTLLETVRELKGLGIDVWFQKENIHSISGDGELLLSVLASFAQEESLSVSENCKWRIQKRMEAGEPVGFYGMYGYDFKNGIITINEKQAAVIRQIFAWYIIDGLGRSKIAKQLNEQGISTGSGGHWSAAYVRDVIQNEKLTGNALLQKRFTVDHLTKKEKRNKGEKPRWFSENTHPAIIDTVTFQRAETIRQERADHFHASDPSQNKYPFSGKILCEHCGKKYRRRKSSGKFYWQCSTFLDEGKTVCPAKQVPEEILQAVSAEVLGLAVFDEMMFKDKISEIRVPGTNRLVFIFSDRRIIKREWKDPSRSESWTPEMKQAARERSTQWHQGGGTA